MWSKCSIAAYVAPGLLVCGSLTYYLGYKSGVAKTASELTAVNLHPSESGFCSYSLPRLSGFKYVKPLMYTEQNCEAEKYQALKTDISSIIHDFNIKGTLSSCSVYFRDFTDETWMSVNPDEKYLPASMLKIGLMVTILRMGEENPSFLDKKLLYNKPAGSLPQTHFVSKMIQDGNSYSVRELLQYMISYSDNGAAWLLLKNVDEKEIAKTHTDLGLLPPKKKGEYNLTAREISVFMNILFDVGYLTIRDSEYAISLLSTSDFTQGLAAGLPANITIAHKFGEDSYLNGPEKQLHETAIVYVANHPYLITVMTKGSDYDELVKVLSAISRTAFDYISTNS